MKNFKFGLLPRILLAIVLGIALGSFLPESRGLLTFNDFFSQFLGFFIPILIVGLVAPSIAEVGNSAGRMLLLTALLAYGSTVVAGFASYFTGATLFPSMIDASAATQLSAQSSTLTPYFSVQIPPLMDVMTALVLAFIVGLGMAYLKGNVLREASFEFREIVTKTIATVIIPLLPIYIFGIFYNMAASGEVMRVVSLFVKIIVVIFVLHILWLVALYVVAGLVSGKNPFKMLGTMLPAYFTALGTQSSAATIPVTLAQAVRMGVREEVAGFVVPLCATIHLSGSMLKIVACALALMMMQGMEYNLSIFAGFIMMLGITMVAAPGVPGGAIMAALGVLTSILGFGPADQALMISLYIAMDSFGTACNVTGDGALAMIIDRIKK
ncbi:MAG: dicarboxylate/amino acid:cation symporter [Alistipes sp.]|nr:dicarboxylate/amino acid:cation symporter [Alistipes sp.]MBQ5914863.1 dicarboxylate/amino acid:cation symporter [Alistipes sp.]MBR5802083.1 dicarboxylate/amino acid:cation symporter [Alistipes sp.]